MTFPENLENLEKSKNLENKENLRNSENLKNRKMKPQPRTLTWWKLVTS
jgi:hypothetical protein